jgi:hypothetical protein
MLRRHFLFATSVLLFGVNGGVVHAATRKFVFKIKTKSGGIVGNILIEAKDQFAAVSKLKQRYPGCEIWEGKEK